MSEAPTIWSGGQSGADKAALIVAREIGFPTGGYAPLNFMTEFGPDYELRDIYGLKDCGSSVWSTRTKWNAQHSDMTIWYGKTGSAGYQCTKKWADAYKKPFFPCYPVGEILSFILENRPTIINVAGNRLSKNPRIVATVREEFGQLLLALRDALLEELLLARKTLEDSK